MHEATGNSETISIHELIQSIKARVVRNLREQSLNDAIFFAEKALVLNQKRYEQSQTLT